MDVFAQLSGWMGGLLGVGFLMVPKVPPGGGSLGAWIRCAGQRPPWRGVPWTLDLPGPRIRAGGGGCFKVTLVLYQTMEAPVILPHPPFASRVELGLS